MGWRPEASAQPEPGQPTRERAALLADEIHRLSVSTIHAFCQRLLGTYPLEAGLHPRFVVDAEEEAISALVIEVVEGALRSLDGDPGRRDWEVIAEAGVDPPLIAETLQSLVTNGVTAEDLAMDPFADELVANETARFSAALSSFAEAEEGRFEGLSKAAKSSIAARDLIRDLISRQTEISAFGSYGEVVNLAAGWDSTALKRISDWAKNTFNGTEEKCLAERSGSVARAAGELFDILDRLVHLRPVEFISARRVLAPLLDRVERRRTARGIVSFNDLLFRATRLVESTPEVVRELVSEIDQLLVDEFQDTDAVQCRLVETLGFAGRDAPGLFVVGDPKQSIYTWRNADLAAYQRFVSTVLNHGGGRYPLIQNFRSVEPILDEVAAVIEPVMIEVDEVQPPFVPLEPTGERVGAAGCVEGGRSAVEYWVTWPAGEDGAGPAPSKSGLTTAFEADAIARDINDLVRRGGARWGDIAILLRATTAQEDLLECFRRRGIPYEVAREKEFYKQREVVEVAALIRVVLDPTDQVALLTVLRSDVVGVPDAALVPLWDAGFADLAAGLGLTNGDESRLKAVVEAAFDGMPSSQPGANSLPSWPVSLLRAAAVIAELRRVFESDPPDVFVERVRSLWLAEVTAAARFLGRFRRARLERFFTELEGRLADGTGGVTALTRFLRQAVKEGQAGAVGGEPDLQADAVHVMTIHGAKGLDFKHVYVIQVHRSSTGGGRDSGPDVLPLAGGREYRLFGWPTPGFSRARKLKDRQSKAEMVRLLYVAITRAKERLVVSGGWNGQPRDKDPLDAGGFADLLESRMRFDELAGQISDQAARRGEETGDAQWIVPALGWFEGDAGDESDRGEEPEGLRVPASEDAAALAEAGRSSAATMQRPYVAGASSLEDDLDGRYGQEEGARTSAPTDRVVAKAVGTAVHRILETLDLSGDLAAQLEERLAGETGELERSLSEPARTAAIERLAALVESISGGACLQHLARIAGAVVGREVALAAPPDAAVGPVGAITGVVDLVYRDPEDDHLVVADYKTDSVSDAASVAERVQVYEPQVRTYARALREALDLDHQPHVELWFLHADEIVRM